MKDGGKQLLNYLYFKCYGKKLNKHIKTKKIMPERCEWINVYFDFVDSVRVLIFFF